MAYDGRSVANFVLDICDKGGQQVTNLSLQKIVYFCHVWSLVKLKRPLIRHSFEAWAYGPVLQYLYRDFKHFDSDPITSRAEGINKTTGKKEVASADFDDETRNLIQDVVGFYGRLSAGHLVDLTHAEGGPWHKAWNHGSKTNPGMRIADEGIVEFYAQRPSSDKLN